jgi:predicted kinase
MPDAMPPLFVVVSGKPGAGKTTLARRLSENDALGLHVLARDAIKAGLVVTQGAETDEIRSTIVPRSFDLFFDTIEAWLRAGVSLIAEYGFSRWSEPRLRALVPLARTVVLHCDTSDAEAARRFIARERANPLARPDVLEALIERMERGAYDWRISDPLGVGAPLLRVDTTSGYVPDLSAIVAFCRGTPWSPRRRPGANGSSGAIARRSTGTLATAPAAREDDREDRPLDRVDQARTAVPRDQ